MRNANRLRMGSLVGLATILVLAISAFGQLAMLQEGVISVYEEASPSVVHITVRGTSENMFMQPVPVSGSGSGFLFDELGHIVTNYHVIEGAEEITIAFGGNDCCEAEIIGVDPSTDLAVIRVDPVNLPIPLNLGESSALRIGQFVVAIGNPFGLEQTMTFGIVSALERVIQSPDGRFVGEAIQTDAPINPGNSGGPLLDLDGRVVGVTSQIISPVAGSSGVGFAISADTVKRVVPALISDGRFPHPFLGISGIGLSADVIDVLMENGVDAGADRGVLITSISVAGPADLAGLRPGTESLAVGGLVIPVGGDVILALDGTPVNSMLEIIFYMDTQTRVGDRIEVTYMRDGEVRESFIVVGERPTGA